MSVREYYLRNKEVFQVTRRKFSPQNVETPFATLIPFQHFATPYRAWRFISQLLLGISLLYEEEKGMAEIKVKCPYCGSEEINLYGKNARGKQRYLCKNNQCSHKTFLLDYAYNASKPGVKKQAFDMIMNGSGTRDTGRVLHISPNTVTGMLKKTTLSEKSK